MGKVRYVVSRVFSTLLVSCLVWKFINALSDSCAAKGIDPFVGIIGWVLVVVCIVILVAAVVFTLWLWNPKE